jgi:hypothetical protein
MKRGGQGYPLRRRNSGSSQEQEGEALKESDGTRANALRYY